MFECPGCAQRRAAIAAAGRRMADWMRRPGIAPPPMDGSKGVRLPDHIVEVRALATFLADRVTCTEADWNRLTEEVRNFYREKVKAGL